MSGPIDVARERLRAVLDPETAVNIVDLGLIREIAFSNRILNVVMTFTTEACPVGPALIEETRAALAGISGVERVDIHLTFDPPWTPERITPAGRDQLAR